MKNPTAIQQILLSTRFHPYKERTSVTTASAKIEELISDSAETRARRQSSVLNARIDDLLAEKQKSATPSEFLARVRTMLNEHLDSPDSDDYIFITNLQVLVDEAGNRMLRD